MRKSDAEAVLYRTSENNARAPAAPTASVQSSADGTLFGDERDEMLARSLGVIIAVTRRELGRWWLTPDGHLAGCMLTAIAMREQAENSEQEARPPQRVLQ
jgi:hypothetical protein